MNPFMKELKISDRVTEYIFMISPNLATLYSISSILFLAFGSLAGSASEVLGARLITP